MDKFSVIASLVLIGLFLIASPSDGYVVGYIDLSDQRLQSSLLKRQDESIMNNKMAEPEEDGGFIYKSNIREEIDPGSSSLVPKFPNQEYHDISSNQVAAEKENGETSQNENDNISILYKSADRKAEEERMKKHKENDDNLPGLFVQSML